MSLSQNNTSIISVADLESNESETSLPRAKRRYFLWHRRYLLNLAESISDIELPVRLRTMFEDSLVQAEISFRDEHTKIPRRKVAALREISNGDVAKLEDYLIDYPELIIAKQNPNQLVEHVEDLIKGRDVAKQGRPDNSGDIGTIFWLADAWETIPSNKAYSISRRNEDGGFAIRGGPFIEWAVMALILLHIKRFQTKELNENILAELEELKEGAKTLRSPLTNVTLSVFIENSLRKIREIERSNDPLL